MRTIQFLLPLLLAGPAAQAQTPEEAQCADDILKTDYAFAAYSVGYGPIAAFAQFLEEDGMQLPSGAMPILGRDNVVEAMKAGPEFELDWDPKHAESSASCDLGWTWGTYEATFPDSTGALLVSRGKYVNVWRRNADGNWRVVIDAGNQSGLPLERRLRIPTENALESINFPAARIELSNDFRYIGRFDFEIPDFATGERYVFADTINGSGEPDETAPGGLVSRLFIAHFEEIPAETDNIFRYSFDDAMEIAGFKFRQNPYAYSTAASIADNPSGEAAKTAELLRRAGLELEDELVMSRYVMVPDAERKHEMILFYIETVSASGLTLDELYGPNGEDSAALGELDAHLQLRAMQAFTITPK